MAEQRRIAIIGAGISGLRLAWRLSDHAVVRIFEKSRGFGGRMSNRRVGEFQFDHGAQYFTAHGAAFRRFLDPYLAEGTVAHWAPRLAAFGGGEAPVWTAPRYVAVPGMNALAKRMAVGLDVQRATRIGAIRPDGAGWRLTDEAGADCGCYDWVISTAPAEQSARLMPGAFAAMEPLASAGMQGCYSLMVGLEAAVDPGWDAAVVREGPLAWVALNHSKPGRSAAFSLLSQSRNDWAEAHMETDQAQVQQMLLEACEELLRMDLSTAACISLHRWRFAKATRPTAEPFLLDASRGLAAAGDWCGAGRVEAGFDSADRLANRLLEVWT